jgi:hypothetical protein
MTNTHRITTAAAVLLTLAAAGAPTAAARPAFDPPTVGNQAPTSVYSRPDKSMVAVKSLSAAVVAKTSVPPSLPRPERYRVAALSALSDRQLAAAFGVAPHVAAKVGPPQAVIRVQTPQSGFDWGDAGIGASAGFMLAMLGLGGGLLISRQRPRRARPTTPLSS